MNGYEQNAIESGGNVWWAVITELDGEDPGSAFYRWRDALVGNVQRQIKGANSEMGPIERRMAAQSEEQYDQGIIVQESVIFAKSQSLAETIAGIIYWDVGQRMLDNGAKRRPLVLVTRVDMSQAHMPPADYEALERTRAILGARGRKPAPVEYAVSCHECRTVTADEQPKGRVLQCPNCRGLKITFREGRPFHYGDDPEMDVVDVWRRSRFPAGVWEPTELGGDQPMPEDAPEIVGTREHDTAELVLDSDRFLANVRKIEETHGRDRALDLLDAAFLARAHYADHKNQSARIEAATRYFANNGDPTAIDLAARPTRVDMLDVALLEGPHNAITYLLEAQEQDGGQ